MNQFSVETRENINQFRWQFPYTSSMVAQMYVIEDNSLAFWRPTSTPCRWGKTWHMNLQLVSSSEKQPSESVPEVRETTMNQIAIETRDISANQSRYLFSPISSLATSMHVIVCKSLTFGYWLISTPLTDNKFSICICNQFWRSGEQFVDQVCEALTFLSGGHHINSQNLSN